jgi:hypothetical protein
MHSQNQVLLTISHTDRVQHTTEVQVQEVLHGHTAHLHQVQATTEAVHLREAATVTVVAETTIAVATVVAEVAVAHIPGVPAEVLQEAAEVLQEAAGVLREEVLRLQVVVNF